MKLCLIVLAVLSMFVALHATDPNYDISRFRPCDLSDYSLYFVLGNNSGLSDVDQVTLRNTLENNGILRGSYLRDSRKYRFSASSYINPNMYLSYRKAEDSNGEKEHVANYYIDTNHGLTYRWYWDALFMGIGVTEGYRYDTSKQHTDEQTAITEQTIKQRTVSSNNALWFGIGRIYECQEAYIAWYMCRELEKNGCLNQSFPPSAIDSLATLLYQLRSVHKIDPYQKNRVKLAALIDYVKSCGYVDKEQEVQATAILLQLWQVNVHPIYTGYEFAVNPNVEWDYSRRTTYDDEWTVPSYARYRSTTYTTVVSCKYYKPIRNVFQVSGQAVFTQYWNGYTSDGTQSSFSTKLLPYSLMTTTSSFSWSPDFRSTAYFQLNGEYVYRKQTILIISSPKTTSADLSNQNRLINAQARLAYTRNLTDRTSCNASVTGKLMWQRRLGTSLHQEKSLGLSFSMNYYLY